MDTTTYLGGENAYKLAHAILLYSDGQKAFATIHEPQPGPRGQGTVLGPGRGVSTAFVKALASELGNRMPIEVLPEHVLVRTPDVMMWWRPASIAPMFFKTDKTPELAPLRTVVHGRRVPHPPLVFRASGRRLWVRALSQNQRPSPTTRLFQAPYFNVSPVGSLCTGTMRKPAGHGVDTITDWERAFFESEFTHPLPGAKLTRYRGGFVPLWVDLARRQAKATARRPSAFPVDALVAAPKDQTLLAFAQSDADAGQN